MVTPNPDPTALRRVWPDWKKLLRTARTGDTQPLRLERRHVYILPTRAGLFYAVLLVCMLIGSINYSLSLGFLLTFLLAGLGVVAMLHTWRNLVSLQLQTERMAPVYAGQLAHFRISIAETNGRARYAIAVRRDDGEDFCADIAAASQATVNLPAQSSRRGWLALGRLTVHTAFPLGLFRAWSYAQLPARCLVYPLPAAPGLAFPAAASAGSGSLRSTAGDEDFSGLREHHPGDSLRRVDWKASARAEQLLAKQFDTASGGALWLDWQATLGRDDETRIAQLARWVLDAQAAGADFGLRLPGREIAPASGEHHGQACLQALALHGLPE